MEICLFKQLQGYMKTGIYAEIVKSNLIKGKGLLGFSQQKKIKASEEQDVF